MHLVSVSGLAIDMGSNAPVVLLKETEGKRVLPIWIGPYEAMAIAMELAGITSKRPLTHDLMKMVISGLGGKITKVEITELKDQTFYARIWIQQDDSILNIDARPSDSIALALRVKAPIYVASDVFNLHLGTEETEEERARNLRERLKRINPEEFGNFSFS